MKVLYLILGQRIGGPQRRSLLIAEKIKKYGIKIIFCLPEEDGEFSKILFEKGYKYYSILTPLPKGHNFILKLISLLRWLIGMKNDIHNILEIIKKEKIDIIHINGFLGLSGIFAAKKVSIPFVFHVMGTMYPKVIVRFFMNIICLLDNSIIVATGEKVRRYYLGKRRSRSIVLYDPIDIEYFSPERFDLSKKEEIKRRLGLNEKEKIVISVGNINPAKGYQYLIKSIGYILKNYKIDVRVLIVGGIFDSQKRYFKYLKENINAYNLSNCVSILGQKKEIAPLLAISDLFVLASVTEGTPNAILEAMSMELAVVATDVGGISELIGRNERGILVKPKKPKDLGNAITYLLSNDSIREKMGKLGREWVLKHCDVEKYIKKIARIYMELMNMKEVEDNLI